MPSDVTVHRTWTLDLPFTLRKGIKKLLTRGKAPTSSSALAPAGRPGLMNRLQGLIANLLLPDPQIGWLPFAYPAARRIIRSRKIDAVIITVPPFSSVKLAARLRKAFPALPIVLDFRDEWLTTTLELVSFNNNERARRIARQTESEAVSAATAVVAVTRNAADELRKRYPRQPSTKFLTVPNGYDDTPSPRPHTEPQRVDKVTLTYMGSVYGTTDPRTLLEAVAGLPADVRDRLRIRFIGHVETPAYRRPSRPSRPPSSSSASCPCPRPTGSSPPPTTPCSSRRIPSTSRPSSTTTSARANPSSPPSTRRARCAACSTKPAPANGPASTIPPPSVSSSSRP
ncbi:glycosyltransferase [Cystobacter fuscus]